MCSNTRKTSCFVHGVFTVAFASLAISKENKYNKQYKQIGGFYHD